MDRHEQQQFSQFARHVASATSNVAANGVVDSIQSSVAAAAAAAAAANALANSNNVLAANNNGNNNGNANNNNELSSQVRTLFVSGLPMDAKPRELYLLFRAYKVSLTLHCVTGRSSGPV